MRNYDLYGVETRLRRENAAGELTMGAKWHHEAQARRQVNANSARGRTGSLVENNLRETTALAGFVAHRINLGRVAITPILRHERIEGRRRDLLQGRDGGALLERTLPGIGVTWDITEVMTAYAGLHEGFAPPRVEDLIGGNGTVTDVDPETSTNFELGLRGTLGAGVRYQLAYFHNDFSNLIAVGSIAGGATPLSQGEALFEGIELGSTLDLADGWYGNIALTWLANAEQTTAFRNVATHTLTGVAGNRQPYSPEFSATLALGYATNSLSIQIDIQHLSEQFTDFANTVVGSADGQRGLINPHTIFGATLNYSMSDRWRGFVTVKNLTDETYIVDRTRGIQLGMPRVVHAGLRVTF